MKLKLLFICLLTVIASGKIVYGPQIYEIKHNKFSIYLSCDKVSNIKLYVNSLLRKECKSKQAYINVTGLKANTNYSYYFIIDDKVTSVYSVKTRPRFNSDKEIKWVKKPVLVKNKNIIKFTLNREAYGCIEIKGKKHDFLFNKKEAIDVTKFLPAKKVKVKLVVYGKSKNLVHHFSLKGPSDDAIIKLGPIITGEGTIFMQTVNTRVDLYVNGRLVKSNKGSTHEFKIGKNAKNFFIVFPEKAVTTSVYKINNFCII